jgi:hypothetical protein
LCGLSRAPALLSRQSEDKRFCSENHLTLYARLLLLRVASGAPEPDARTFVGVLSAKGDALFSGRSRLPSWAPVVGGGSGIRGTLSATKRFDM